MQDDELFYESDSIETVLSAFTSIYSGTTVGSLAVIAFVSLEYASFYYSAPGMRAEYCIEHACLCLSRWLAGCLAISLSVWLAGCLSGLFLAYHLFPSL